MTAGHYDVLVVGAGPAGSVAALVLARGGARVALVDKATFPRDKACGDLVGPRGVRTLADLGLRIAGPAVGDMEVVGPTGRRVLLRARAGRSYPGHGLVVPRVMLDGALRDAAVEAGAAPFTGRAAAPVLADDGQLGGFHLDGAGGVRLTADVVVGADGALSRVAAAAGLVDEARVIWGFALRGYGPGRPRLPRIHLWEPAGRPGYPGYGWVFPGVDGRANVGLGVGTRGDRRRGVTAARDLDGFAAAAGWGGGRLGRTLGGWLKLGMVGTIAARGRTLLVGDAAGLVNPLQGEGIAQALGSGRAAAESVLAAGPVGAAARYRGVLAARYAPYASTTAPVASWMLGHPRGVAALGRILTAPGVGRALAGGWSIYWNDLLDGAEPGPARGTARLADRLGRLVTAGTDDRRRLRADLGDAATGGGTGSG